MPKREYVGDMAYLARTCGKVRIYCDNIRPGYPTLREALCGHSTAVEARDLLAKYGPDMTIQAWADQLYCSKCGSRDHVDLKFTPPSNEYGYKG